MYQEKQALAPQIIPIDRTAAVAQRAKEGTYYDPFAPRSPAVAQRAKVAINDDPALEHEADVMGAKALSAGAQLVQKKATPALKGEVRRIPPLHANGWTAQRKESERPRMTQHSTSELNAASPSVAPAKNGLPSQLKAGIESMSGLPMDDVKVHYNSDKPAQLQAHAYAQGTDIHLAPGQERHLPHEAWHVVQQKEGRVRPTVQRKRAFMLKENIEQRGTQQPGIWSNTQIQCKLDDQDWINIISVDKTDIEYSALLSRLYEIYKAAPQDFNYGASDSGGHATLIDGRATATIKNKAMHHLWESNKDKKRQGDIVHEMTHISEMLANNNNSFDFSDIQGKIQNEDNGAKKTEILTSLAENKDLNQWGEQQASDLWSIYEEEKEKFTKDQNTYLSNRMKYVNSTKFNNQHHEYASVFTELTYYFKKNKLTDNNTYKKAREGAIKFFYQREDKIRDQKPTHHKTN